MVLSSVTPQSSAMDAMQVIGTNFCVSDLFVAFLVVIFANGFERMK